MENKLKEYQNLILDWAKDKNITTEDCIPMQRLKLLEEVGELAKAILKSDIPEQVDGIGDTFVVLTILAEQCKTKFDLQPLKVSFEEYSTSELLGMIIYSEMFVNFEVFIEICKRLELDMVSCVSSAWDEIKDRKGKTENGVFIKN